MAFCTLKKRTPTRKAWKCVLSIHASLHPTYLYVSLFFIICRVVCVHVGTRQPHNQFIHKMGWIVRRKNAPQWTGNKAHVYFSMSSITGRFTFWAAPYQYISWICYDYQRSPFFSFWTFMTIKVTNWNIKNTQIEIGSPENNKFALSNISNYISNLFIIWYTKPNIVSQKTMIFSFMVQLPHIPIYMLQKPGINITILPIIKNKSL